MSHSFTIIEGPKITKALVLEFTHSNSGTMSQASASSSALDIAHLPMLSSHPNLVLSPVATSVQALLGFVVFTTWLCDNTHVLWISLMNVHLTFRKRSIATNAKR